MTSAIKKDKPQTRLHTIKVKGRAGKKTSSGPSDGEQRNARTQKQTEDGTVQIEEIVNKGLDLAEVGIGLGVNIVARLGTIFKDQVFDKLSSSDILNSTMSNMSSAQQDENAYHNNNQEFEDQTQTQNNTASSSTQEEQSYYLFNRTTLTPASELSLSFSINNDSLTSSKQIKITVEKFTGEAHQNELDADLFSVLPDKIEIAAADFEKFILKGKLPSDIQPDKYHGWIIVEEQQTYRIPVALFVTAAQQDSSIQQAASQQTVAE